MGYVLLILLKSLFYAFGTFLFTLYLIYFDQKLMNFIRMQPIGTTLKLRGIFFPLSLLIHLFKVRLVFPDSSYRFLYVLLPLFLTIMVFSLGILIPSHDRKWVLESDYGALMVIVLSNALIFLTALIGWASQSQYSLQGSMRIFGRFMASSLLFFIILMTIVLWVGSMNLCHIVSDQKSVWFVVPLFPVFVVHMTVLLMRGSCAPFGSSESSIDLMGGYKSLYSGGFSVLLMASEHLHFLLLAAVTVILFFGGWLPLWNAPYLPGFFWFFLKFVVLLMTISWIKAVLPNVRHDQLIRLSFKIFIPASGCLFVFYALIKILLGE